MSVALFEMKVVIEKKSGKIFLRRISYNKHSIIFVSGGIIVEIIQSKQNQRVKDWRKLHTLKGRRQSGSYLIEGDHLIEEAHKFGQNFKALILDEGYFNKLSPEEQIGLSTISKNSFILSSDLFKDLCHTETPQGIMAEISLEASEKELDWQGHAYLVCDQIQDPGNLGTIIRTADAAGVAGVVLTKGCVDLYNDKVIRSSQGSIWHLPIISMESADVIDLAQNTGLKIYTSALHARSISYRQVDYTCPYLMVVGNEGQGVSSQWLEVADEILTIPMPGQAESLNVAIATGILLFYPIKD